MIQKSHQLLSGLTLAGLTLASLYSASLAQTQPDDPSNLNKSLDTVELNVLGQKYSNLPTDNRLHQLETQLDTSPTNKNSSTSYRVSQLLNAQQVAVSQTNKAAAIRLYNQAIDATNQPNGTDNAIGLYHQAIHQDPYLVPAYNNLANLQERKLQFQDAINTYQEALVLSPREALLHFNLAVLLEKQGRIVDAYDHYHQYVELSPNPNPEIVELIKNYDNKRLSGKGQPDYFDVVREESNGEYLAWPEQRMPINVYIQLMDPDQANFISCVEQDLLTWRQATNGFLRFREVTDPSYARIIVTLRDGPLMDPGASIGHASFDTQLLNQENPMDNLRVSITVNTGERTSDSASDLSLDNRKQQVSKIVLHELGHAVGIWGHSPDPGDIMYTHPIVSQLSQRDVNTIRRLYNIR